MSLDLPYPEISDLRAMWISWSSSSEEGYEGAFDQFMGLKEGLETILGRPVDLLTGRRFRNPIFQEEITKTKRPVYVA